MVNNTISGSVPEGGDGSNSRSSTPASRRSSGAESTVNTELHATVSGSGSRITGSTRETSSISSRASVATITNYGNATAGASSQDDRIPAPPSFSGSALEAMEAHRSLSEQGDYHSERSVVIEDHLEQYHRIMNQYQDLHDYVHWRRQEMLNEITAAENSYTAVERAVVHFGPSEKQAVGDLFATYAKKIEELKARVSFFDAEIMPTRERIRDELIGGLNSLPGHVMLRIVQETQWPNESISQDLGLPYDYLLLYRGTYALPKVDVRTEEAPTTETLEKARIRELEAMVQQLSLQIKRGDTGGRLADKAATTKLIETKPEADRIDYQERRKRTRFPTFGSGTVAEAQGWVKRYELLCEFVNFTDKEKVAELSVLFIDAALSWYLNTDHSSWATVKRGFLKQFGGGTDPSKAAHNELKSLRKGRMSMKQFGPLITDLLHRAEIYRPSMQLDYFKERLNDELQMAMVYRGPKTLEEAIHVMTSVEEELQRMAQGKTAPSALPGPYAASSSGSSSTTQPLQQNYQQTRGYGDRRSGKEAYDRNQGSRKASAGGRPQPKGTESRTCFICGKRGHLAKNCRRRKQEHSQSQQMTQDEAHADGMVDIFAHLGKPIQNTQVAKELEVSTQYRFLKEFYLKNGGRQTGSSHVLNPVDTYSIRHWNHPVNYTEGNSQVHHRWNTNKSLPLYRRESKHGRYIGYGLDGA
ncbi:hypothetical protein A0J61_10736 [Choanephora cucurbitarum]|uniref:CCHC-type domain-containing protein n=1 Tax=Choanephora cucurbitarum TaxID=101091 RepID=A0A1C7MWF6_9FUNG|nr:hypothetical protein A0J61_10736 [Choanephora cucurbitarum]